MNRKFSILLLVTLMSVATTLFGGYLDTHDYTCGTGWEYDSANDMLECVLGDDCQYSSCSISVPGHGWLVFKYRVVSGEDSLRVLPSYGYPGTGWESGLPQYSICADSYGETSDEWKNARLAVRESGESKVLIEFEDWSEANGKVQVSDLAWESADVMPVTITFSLRGGEFENGEPSTMVCTETYENLPVPVRENCTFLGWAEKLDGYYDGYDSDYVEDGVTLPLSSNVTLCANWEVPADVALNPTGELRDETRGNWMELSSDVTISTRQSWHGGDEPDDVACFSIQEPGDFNLVTFHVNGLGTLDFGGIVRTGWGDTDNVQISLVIDGVTVAQASYPNDSYAYSSSRHLSGKYDVCKFPPEGDTHEISVIATCTSTFTSISADMEVSAFQWTEETATSKTVSFDARGGSACGARQYAVGKEYGSLPVPTRENATFKGWFTKPDGGEMVQETDFVRPSVTKLYARWTTSLKTALGGRLTVKSGDGSWIGSADISRKNDGSWTASTTCVGYGVTNVMSTTVSGRGILSFWWVQGIQGWFWHDDRSVRLASSLTLWVDGVQVAEGDSQDHPGDSGWSHLSYAITKTGSHTIEWRFVQKGDPGEEWNPETVADIISDVNRWWAGDGTAYGPGAWVQDVTWKAAGKVNDFPTWARAVGCGSWLTGELPTIESYYTKKIKSNSKDYRSVMLRALTKIAKLGENKNLVAILKKFGFTPNYQNLGNFFGSLNYSSAPLSNAVVDSTAKEAIPVLKSALADLELIPKSWTGSIALSPNDYPVDETTYVDLADIMFARAAVKGALASLAVAQGYDLSVTYKKVDSRVRAYDDEHVLPSMKELVGDHPSFMKSVRNKTRLGEAKSLVRSALETAQAADKLMVKRSTDELHFFEYDERDEKEIQFARNEIAKALKALDSTVVVTDDDFKDLEDYRLKNLNQRVTLKPFFTGALTRKHLPAKYDTLGIPVLTSLPDATFGGILPGLTATKVEGWRMAYALMIDENGFLTDCKKSLLPADLILPDDVKHINRRAFLRCTDLVSVVIPESVLEIDSDAFSTCTNLKKVILKANRDYSLELPEGCKLVPAPTLTCVNEDEILPYYSIGQTVRLEFETSEYCTLTVSGLPKGLKFVQNGVSGVISGAPTTASVSKVKVVASNGAVSVSKSVTLSVGMVTVKLSKTENSVGMKSLSGAGAYAVGKTATLKATAATGSVFAGWYWDADEKEPCEDLGVDYRATTGSIKVSNANEHGLPITLYARFVTATEDKSLLTAGMDGVTETTASDGRYSRTLDIESNSLPSAKVTGLPKGLSYSSSTRKISGKATVPGTYTVTLSLSNASTKKTEKFKIVVPNITSAKIAGLGDASTADTPYVYTVGVVKPSGFLSVSASGYSLRVSGLPAGLKFNSKTGAITGTATKAGTYTVTFIATKKGAATETSTRTFTVTSLPSDVVGTFSGFLKDDDGTNLGTFTLTATSLGKITAKVVNAKGAYSFSGAWNSSSSDADGYYAKMTTRNGDVLTARVTLAKAWNEYPLVGAFKVAGTSPDADGESVYAQKNLFADKWYLAAESDGDGGWLLSLAASSSKANLTLTPKSDGTMTISGKLGSYSVSGSSVHTLIAFDTTGVLIVDFAPVATAGKTKKVISINCSLDMSRVAGSEAGSATIVE